MNESSREIRKDPRVSATEQDLRAQFALMIQVRDKLTEVTDAVIEIRKARGEVAQAAKRMEASSGAPAAKALPECQPRRARTVSCGT